MTDIERDGYQVDPIRFAVEKKQTLIESPITELETGRVSTPTSANTFIDELEMYKFKKRDSGHVSDSAPSGVHDNYIDALALAVSASPAAPRTISGSFLTEGLSASERTEFQHKPVIYGGEGQSPKQEA